MNKFGNYFPHLIPRRLIDRQYHELFVPAGWQEDINKLGSFVATIQANEHCCDGLIF